MREIGEVRVQTNDDAEGAAPYVGQARVLLGQLKTQLLSAGLAQGARSVVLEDGAAIRVSTVHGQDAINITPVAPAAAAAPQPEIPKPEIPQRELTPRKRLVTACVPGPDTETFSPMWMTFSGNGVVSPMENNVVYAVQCQPQVEDFNWTPANASTIRMLHPVTLEVMGDVPGPYMYQGGLQYDQNTHQLYAMSIEHDVLPVTPRYATALEKVVPSGAPVVDPVQVHFPDVFRGSAFDTLFLGSDPLGAQMFSGLMHGTLCGYVTPLETGWGGYAWTVAVPAATLGWRGGDTDPGEDQTYNDIVPCDCDREGRIVAVMSSGGGQLLLIVGSGIGSAGAPVSMKGACFANDGSIWACTPAGDVYHQTPDGWKLEGTHAGASLMLHDPVTNAIAAVKVWESVMIFGGRDCQGMPEDPYVRRFKTTSFAGGQEYFYGAQFVNKAIYVQSADLTGVSPTQQFPTKVARYAIGRLDQTTTTREEDDGFE